MEALRHLQILPWQGGDANTLRWRLMVSLGTVLVDFVTVLAIVAVASVSYHSFAYEHQGNIGLTVAAG